LPADYIIVAAAIAAARPDTVFLLGGYGHDAIADDLSPRSWDWARG
jgi:hypothetical protein